MYVDALLQLSGTISGNTITGQTVTGNGVSVLSTNTVDLASGGVPSGQTRDIGEGSDFAYGRFENTVASTGGTSIEFQIITADDAALTTNVKVLGTTGAILTAALILGARFACQINPVIGSKGQRYIGARYVIVGNMTTGAYVADVGAELQDGQKFYPNGFAVL